MSQLALAVEDVLIHLVHNRPSDISSNLNERKLLIGGWLGINMWHLSHTIQRSIQLLHVN
jgi:hypothetical protein